MLRKLVLATPRQWPQWLPLLLFAVCEVPQAFTGFCTFKLLYEQQPWRVLDILRKNVSMVTLKNLHASYRSYSKSSRWCPIWRK